MIGVLTSAKNDFHDGMKSVKEAYCHIYGHEFVFSTDDFFKGRAFEWRKVGMILSYLPKFDWIVYLAPNVGFANFTTQLERVVNEQSKGRGIIAARDSSVSANTDVLFFRNDETSFRFLRTWADEKTYVKWGGGEKHDAFSFYRLANDVYGGKVSLVVPCRVFNSLSKCHGNDVKRRYHMGDFIENCSMLNYNEVGAETDKILKTNNEYIKGIKKIAKVKLEGSVISEDSMIRRAEKVCRPLEPKSNESVDETIGEVAHDDSARDGLLNSLGDVKKNISPTKIVIETKNEKITIFKNSVDNGALSKDAERAMKNGKWGFAYPNI